jgi:EmrB/QacA subfamily drug resistance transporter
MPTKTRTRWVGLLVIASAQLVVALDATVLNIALPSAQRDLGFSDGARQWTITAYTLALAGCLLLGGRIADTIGHRRTFLIGLVAFGTASALAGSATTFWVLVLGRAGQGAAGALLIPAALALLAMTFPAPAERAKAFGVYGAIASGGGAAGLLLGGLLTEYVSWRWCLFVNVAIIAVVVPAGLRALPSSVHRGRRPLDIPGATTVSLALVGIVYACGQSAWLFLIPSVALLVLFVLRERRTADPLLPLAIVTDRHRIAAFLAVAAAVTGIFGMFLVLTYYLQVVAGYSPVRTGVAFLPLSGAIVVSSYLIAGRLGPRLRPWQLMVPGMLVASSGLLLLGRLDTDPRYLTVILPAQALVGLGIGCVFTPAIGAVTSGVEPRYAGVAAATVNTANQAGSSIGTAALNSVAVGAAAGHGLVHGYVVATTVAAGILAAAALVVIVLNTSWRNS